MSFFRICSTERGTYWEFRNASGEKNKNVQKTRIKRCDLRLPRRAAEPLSSLLLKHSAAGSVHSAGAVRETAAGTWEKKPGLISCGLEFPAGTSTEKGGGRHLWLVEITHSKLFYPHYLFVLICALAYVTQPSVSVLHMRFLLLPLSPPRVNASFCMLITASDFPLSCHLALSLSN